MLATGKEAKEAGVFSLGKYFSLNLWGKPPAFLVNIRLG
jgi:hypothetical protein